jgi:hypothetical protein
MRGLRKKKGRNRYNPKKRGRFMRRFNNSGTEGMERE